MTDPSVSRIPIEDRSAYATVVAMMAAADDVVVREELNELTALCRALELDEERTRAVVRAAQGADRAAFDASIERMKQSNLRFTLLADCVALALADEQVAAAERASLRELAQDLGVAAEQLETLEAYVVATRRAAREEGAAEDHEATGRDLANQLKDAGIPIGALGLGSALGFTVTGVTTGLGALLAGLGIATGVGAVLGLGMGTVLGVRWLRERLREKPAVAPGP